MPKTQPIGARDEAGIGAAATAACVYFALVFAAGFALGVIRTLHLEPRIGGTAAVLVELPIILGFAWIAAGLVVAGFGVARGRTRLVMGLVAFALLLGAELAVALFVLERSFGDFLAGFATMPGALGLAGQLAFAAMPVIRK